MRSTIIAMIRFPDHPLASAVLAWEKSPDASVIADALYCGTRDVLSARIDRMTRERLRSGVSDDHAWLLDGLISEIGNNAFDHNVGQWPDVPGVLFGYDLSSAIRTCAIADRGQGMRATISRVRPDVVDDLAALKVAFLERISGRAPERRGNGLKFVRSILLNDGVDLLCQSGNAQYAAMNKTEQWDVSQHSLRGCIAILQWTA